LRHLRRTEQLDQKLLWTPIEEPLPVSELLPAAAGV